MFREYGIALSLAVEMTDPPDERAAQWWSAAVGRLYATSAGWWCQRDTAGWSPADGANLVARALAPYGGSVFWRCSTRPERVSRSLPSAPMRSLPSPTSATTWRTYERYTAPLGVGFMVAPETHYGPNVNGYEYSARGTYHFADRYGVGVDRSVATGSGFTAQ